MSIECSECERDLRGGHDPSCSRYRVPGCSRCDGLVQFEDYFGTEEWPATCQSCGLEHWPQGPKIVWRKP